MIIRSRMCPQKGFTIIEILIALAITAFIILSLGNTITQVITINKQNTNLVTVQRQVQQVGFYVSRDVQQARTITLGNVPALTGFPIIMSWIDLGGNTHQVTYSLSAGGIVTRSEAVNGGTSTTIAIATNINTLSTKTKFSPDATRIGYYNLEVTGTITGKITVSETRQYQIMQRTNK